MSSTCWADVAERLDKPRCTNTTWIQRRAELLGLDISHFDPTARVALRSYSDDDLRTAVAGAGCWADVMEKLGKQRTARSGLVQRHAEQLGVDTSHIGSTRWASPVPAGPSLFTKGSGSRLCSGLSIAASWFLDRGYLASVPLEPGPYDLVVESDSGLKRVQIKSTRYTGGNGRCMVRLTRRIYDASAKGNAGGRYRTRPYNGSEVDLFFVIANGVRYLIPRDAVDGLVTLVLDEKYASFRV